MRWPWFTHALSFLVLISATAATAVAQPPPDADPLGPIVVEALRANLGLRQERLAERRVEAEADAARASLLPSVALEAHTSHFDGVPNLGDLVNPAYGALNQLTGSSRFPTDIDRTYPPRYESHVRLVQPIINEAARAQYALARARRQGQQEELRVTARQVAADAQTAYLQHAAARRVTEIYEATLITVRENERVSERLLDAGRVTPEAVLRARAERTQVEQTLAEARDRQSAAARSFNLILDRPLDAPIEVFPDSLLALPLDISADSAVAHGLAAREERRQIHAGVKTALAAKRAATAGFLPSLAVALDYGYQGTEPTVNDAAHLWTTSLVVSWSLFNGGGDIARRAAAQYEADRQQTRDQEAADKIALEIRTAYDAAVVARAAIATADARLEAARRTFTLVRRRFEEGAASPYELVDARTTLTSAELNRVVTAYRYALRRVDLERAAALRELSL